VPVKVDLLGHTIGYKNIVTAQLATAFEQH